jgi:RNA polymerase sigma-70 factor, ECF subfamily
MSAEDDAGRAARFEAIYRHHRASVVAYGMRRTRRDLADDVAAETFAIAWRRFDDMPDDPLPWLLVTARQVLWSRLRAERRRALLRLRLEAVSPRFSEPQVPDRPVLAALATLSSRDRDTLLLVAWDGLDIGSAAAVAGCSSATFSVRRHRARQRLEKALEAASDPPRSASLTAKEPT